MTRSKISTKYDLDDKQKEAMKNFLKCETSAETAGKVIGYSHQQVINMTTTLFRWLVVHKKIDIDKILKDY